MLQNRNSAGMLAGQASLRGLTPLIGITAAATAALLYWIVGEPVFAAGFAAAIIAIAALAFYFKKLFPPTSVEEGRSEEHTSELQSLMRISYAVFCLKQKKLQVTTNHETTRHQSYA